MLRQAMRTIGLAGCMAGLLSVAQAAPIMPVDIAQGVETTAAEQTSFWGRAYPYSYAYRPMSRCVRLVPIETTLGWQWTREWVCSARVRRGVILRARS